MKRWLRLWKDGRVEERKDGFAFGKVEDWKGEKMATPLER